MIEDVAIGSHVVLIKQTSVVNCQANPGSFYVDVGATKLYVHCTDSNAPTGRIVKNLNGWEFELDTCSYITFINFGAFLPFRMFGDPTSGGGVGDTYTNITWDGIELAYQKGALFQAVNNNDYLIWQNCTVHHGSNGLAFSENSVNDGSIAPSHIQILDNTLYDIGSTYGDVDAHAISWNGGDDILIDGNYCYNCGSTIVFYSLTGLGGSESMT
ncbi:unnamed protein product, partial [marine sediment metagenome]